MELEDDADPATGLPLGLVDGVERGRQVGDPRLGEARALPGAGVELLHLGPRERGGPVALA